MKAIEVVASDADLVRLRAKPNFRTLGKRYGKRTPAVAAAAARLDAGAAPRPGGRAGRPRSRWTASRSTYLPEDVAVEREVASDWLVQSDGPFVVALDPG